MEVCKDCDNKKESHEESDSDEYTTAILNGNPTDVSRDLSHYYTKYEDCSSSDDEVDSDEEGEDWEAKIKSREIRSNGDDTEIGSSDLDDIQQLEVTDSSENYIEADDFGDFQSSEQPETYSLSHSQYLEWNQASSSSDEELEMEIDPSTCKEPSVSAGNSSESRRIRLPPLSPGLIFIDYRSLLSYFIL